MASGARDVAHLALGVWNVTRRECRGDVRFLRIAFYPDGRFGTLSVDGTTWVYGSWRLEPTETATARVMGKLTLYFDHHAGPERGVRSFALDDPPVGCRCTSWRGHVGEPADDFLHGAQAAVDAILVGAWQRVGEHNQRGEYAIDRLDLRADGAFGLRIAGGIQRAGRWEFERARGLAGGPVTGTLVLDPAETVFAVERFAAFLSSAPGARLEIQPPESEQPVVLVAPRARSRLARPFVAHWRLVAAADVPVPLEVTLHADGTLEALRASGPPRVRGHWSLQNPRRGADRIEAHIAFTVHLHGYPGRSATNGP